MKGEGTDANYTRAVELYELAAEEGHVRALNGLGFEFFHGHVLSRNAVSRSHLTDVWPLSFGGSFHTVHGEGLGWCGDSTDSCNLLSSRTCTA